MDRGNAVLRPAFLPSVRDYHILLQAGYGSGSLFTEEVALSFAWKICDRDFELGTNEVVWESIVR